MQLFTNKSVIKKPRGVRASVARSQQAFPATPSKNQRPLGGYFTATKFFLPLTATFSAIFFYISGHFY